MSEPVRPIVMNRLSPAAYAALVKSTQARLPTVPKSDGEAHFACGVDFVLRQLREGYVVDGE